MGVGATLGWYWMREAGRSDCSTMNLDNQRWKSDQCTKSWFYICEQEGTSPASPPTTAVLPSSAATPSGSPHVQTATSTSPASPPSTDVLPSSAVTPSGSPHVQTTKTTSEQDLLMCSNNSSVCYRGYSSSYTISSASSGHHMMKSSDYSMVSADDTTHDRFVLKTIKGCRSRLRCATACLKESSCTWFVYLGNNDCLLSGESAVVN
ncbi:uncharacterized protein [Asterias amurensis]|uniref:uncharacterized protein n=1 Tax=Asterias amurensis TaxID=7602 RepID=UPI003AB610C1